jgi:protoheme IX farnesyltransferase
VIVGERRAMDHMVAYTIVMVGMTFLLFPTGLVGSIYLTTAVITGVGFLARTIALRDRPQGAMTYFSYSNVYLAIVFIAIAADVLVLA